MKKILTAILSLIFCFNFIACDFNFSLDLSSSTNDSSNSQNTKTEESTTTDDSSTSETSSENESTIEIQPAPYYGFEILTSMKNTKYLNAYQQIVEGIGNYKTKIDLSSYQLSKEEFLLIMDLYSRDYTEHFWFTNSYQYSIGTYVGYIQLSYDENLIKSKDIFTKKANEIIVPAKHLETDYEKELYIHDYLCKNVVYEETANAHNSYGAIIEGKAVCEGYAEAFQYLLRLVGIKSFICIGDGINNSNNITTSEDHAWNYVEINNEFYHVDVTWDDPVSSSSKTVENIYYAYFNVTDELITKDHSIDSVTYTLPSCKATTYNYFTINGGIIASSDDLNAEKISFQIKLNGMGRFYLKDETMNYNSFYNWCRKNLEFDFSMSGTNKEVIVVKK